jgi:DNA-binding MarR family transcriptional regulator
VRPEAKLSSDADLNRIGALVVALHDRIRIATEEAARSSATFPAALTVLHIWPDGASVEVLAQSLRVSHSRAVRIVDRLEEDGLARRCPDPHDGRALRVQLTADGRRSARAVLAARGRALGELLEDVDQAVVDELGRIAGLLFPRLISGREDARATCRLCDADACGHYSGQCPVTNAADAREGG